MKLFLPDTRQRRTLWAVFAITFMITVLLTAFWETQVVSGAQYALRSEENRLRGITIPAPRGTILDRNGEVVATSITAYSISILPGDSALVRETLVDLAPFLGLSGVDVQALMEKRKQRPNDLLEVTDRGTYSQAAAIEERQASFPNLIVVERPQRYYPAGAAVGQLVGYVTEITKEQLELPRYKEAGYQQGRLIGQAGIEKEYELTLSGQDGARFVEVDSHGRVVDPRTTVGAQPPVAGKPLRLTLDLELQKYVDRVFPDTMKGAVVAMVPSTGEVLALYSHPTFDPNDFVGTIRPQLWRALTTDTLKPMLDRAIQAGYPPASTWKTATAVIGVKLGLVNRDSYMPQPCTGGLYYAGRYARCWKKSGHGYLNLAKAIEQSCNVYFYQLGIRIGLKELTRQGTRMGFGEKTGIDLPGEVAPIFPTGIDWYKTHFGNEPTPSEVLSLAIGQGPNTQTVIDMAQFYSAIAGNGTAVAPHLAASDAGARKSPVLDLGLSQKGMQDIWEGLRLVTEEGGTGIQASLARYKLYGKTGTAQNSQGPDHGWFVGFAGVPGGHPEIVVAVIVEHGLHGDAAAPLAAKVANFYLDRKHGHPFDPEPTWGERARANRLPSSYLDQPGRILVPLPRIGGAVAADSGVDSTKKAE